MKWLGALIVIVGCGGFGYRLAAAYRREERMLERLLRALEHMRCELTYRLTPLPELCRQASQVAGGTLAAAFDRLAQELERQIAPDAERCMEAVLAAAPNLPDKTEKLMHLLGMSLGRFDLDGQLRGLEGICRDCTRELDCLRQGKEGRLRSIQTLGLCAGAALAILFL